MEQLLSAWNPRNCQLIWQQVLCPKGREWPPTFTPRTAVLHARTTNHNHSRQLVVQLCSSCSNLSRITAVLACCSVCLHRDTLERIPPVSTITTWCGCTKGTYIVKVAWTTFSPTEKGQNKCNHYLSVPKKNRQDFSYKGKLTLVFSDWEVLWKMIERTSPLLGVAVLAIHYTTYCGPFQSGN